MGVVRRFVGALLLGAVVLVAVGFATGRVASVVTNGVSMLPVYEAGDLVVVARADRYAVGDVVAYREPQSREVVLHRIVGGGADAYELQGDNNESVDTTTPSARDLIGRQVLHVPTVGRWIGSPLTMACLAGLLLGLSSLLTLGGRRRDADGPESSGPGAGVPGGELQHPPPPATASHAGVAGGPSSGARTGPPWRWWHRALLVADLAVVAGLVAAFVVPPTVVPPPPVPMHLGSLSYSADVAVDDTYPDGRIDTGETVFLRLVDRVGITFRYEGDPALAANARLRVMLESAQGWSTSVAMASVTPVIAGGAELQGVLDLGQLRSMLGRVTDATAIPLTTVELRVEAIVDPESDDPEVTASTTELVFRFDDIVLDLVDTAVISETAAGPAVVTSTPVSETDVSSTEVGGVPRSARRWLLVALLVLVAATATAWPAADRRRDPTAVAASDPVPATIVSDVQLPTDRPLVRLAARADLEQLARATGASMLLRDDGWCAVVAERAVHWWAPPASSVSHVSPAAAAEPTAPTAPTVTRPVAPVAVVAGATTSSLDDVWATSDPRFADDPIAPIAPIAPVAAHELPTVELRLDVVEQLRDETFVPRRPLFGGRRTPAPVRLPPPQIGADAGPSRPVPPVQPAHDPLRTTIDEIVKYLSEVAPPSSDGHVRPQGGGRDLAS